MAIATTSDTVFDGQRTVTKQFTGISDGAGQLTLAPLVLAGSLNPACKAVKVDRITGAVGYGVVELYWDALVPIKFAELSGDQINFDYRKQGGLSNHTVPKATGNILISTIGFSAGSTYSLKLDMRKRYTDKVQVA